jgi:hypothetical protein
MSNSDNVKQRCFLSPSPACGGEENSFDDAHTLLATAGLDPAVHAEVQRLQPSKFCTSP